VLAEALAVLRDEVRHLRAIIERVRTPPAPVRGKVVRWGPLGGTVLAGGERFFVHRSQTPQPLPVGQRVWMTEAEHRGRRCAVLSPPPYLWTTRAVEGLDAEAAEAGERTPAASDYVPQVYVRDEPPLSRALFPESAAPPLTPLPQAFPSQPALPLPFQMPVRPPARQYPVADQVHLYPTESHSLQCPNYQLPAPLPTSAPPALPQGQPPGYPQSYPPLPTPIYPDAFSLVPYLTPPRSEIPYPYVPGAPADMYVDGEGAYSQQAPATERPRGQEMPQPRALPRRLLLRGREDGSPWDPRRSKQRRSGAREGGARVRGPPPLVVATANYFSSTDSADSPSSAPPDYRVAGNGGRGGLQYPPNVHRRGATLPAPHQNTLAGAPCPMDAPGGELGGYLTVWDYEDPQPLRQRQPLLITNRTAVGELHGPRDSPTADGFL